MKRVLFLIAIVFGFLAATLNAKTIYRSDININYFYYSLEPYGEWIEIGYDDFVWRPYKSDYNWRPYSDGRWEWTRHGWYWVSYEPYGWATYHYGRWFYDDYYGWLWMPDNVWAPAWVEWRYNDHYIGWAPLPPYASFDYRRGIHFSISWHSGHIYWNFVRYNHFVSYNIHKYYVERNYVKEVYGRTKYRTNYFAENDRIVNGGVSRRFVERKIGKRLRTKDIVRTNNFEDYNSKDIKKRSGIIDYRPSESKMKNLTIDRKKVVKGRELQSLKPDKIAINRRNVEKRKSDTNLEFQRNGTIKKESEIRTKKESRTPDFSRNNAGKAKDNRVEKNVEKAEVRKSVEKQSGAFIKKNERKSSEQGEIKSPTIKNTWEVQKRTNERVSPEVKNNDRNIRVKTKSRNETNDVGKSNNNVKSKRTSVMKERSK